MKGESVRKGLFPEKDLMNKLSDPILQQKLNKYLQDQGVPVSPYLKVEMSSDSLELERSDVEQVFSQFGELQGCEKEGRSMILQFKDIHSAYFAQKLLNGRLVSNALLSVTWHQPASLKYNCRYDVQINDSEFSTARMIIGSKGIHMKSIIESCCKGSSSSPHDIIKIRVRGKGSGYREGPQKLESNEPLHICVSSKFEDKYLAASKLVEKLLDKVYNDYYTFCLQKRKPVPCFSIVKSENITGRDVNKLLRSLEETDLVDEGLIRELIDIRNEARKQSNFTLADSIREQLKTKGVMLIDGKGARGKSNEVTVWKYIID